MSSVASFENGAVEIRREPGARTWEPSIVPAPVSRDAATPSLRELAAQKKIRTMFIATSTTSTVMENPKSSDSEPMRSGGMSRRKNRTGGSVIV